MVARDVYMRLYGLRDAWQDCVQNALIGLLESLDRYDHRREASFQTYARQRVRGAVFNGIRALRETTSHGTRSYDQMTEAVDRMQSLEEDGAADTFETFVAMTVGLGLGFLLESHSMQTQARPPDAYADIERAELSAAVGSAVEGLPSRERTILVMHYFHHASFVEISVHLGVTGGRVSQLHRRALGLLRARLREHVMVDY